MRYLKNPKLMYVVSMALFGTLGPFIRNIPLASKEIALCRSLLAILPIGLILLLSGQKIHFQEMKKEIPLLLLSGACMGGNWILLFEAYRYTTISVATLSYYFAPVLVMIACPILFKEKMSKKKWICFAMATFGIVLITGTGDLSAGSNHLLGVLFGLGAAVLYACVLILNKTIQKVEGLQRTLFQFLSAIVVLFVYVGATGGFHLTDLTGSGWVYMFIVGVVHTGLTYCLFFSGMKEISGSQVAILSYVDPLVAVLISVLVLGEGITLMQVVGGALILGFTLWNELTTEKERQP